MHTKFGDTIIRLLITLVVLVILEVFASAVVPAMGFKDYTFAFNVLIIIFLAFRVETPLLPYMVLIIQIFHSAFSIEGWAVGCFTGVLVCILINYMKDLMQISSLVSTVIVVQIFQMVWFFIVAIIISAKMNDFSMLLSRVWRFLPESIGLSLFAPTFFKLMSRIWREKDDSEGVHI